LKTADGATLIETDPLSLILCLTDESLIFSEIVDWKLPSLSNRYLEACSEFRCGKKSLLIFESFLYALILKNYSQALIMK
jgi:hypothetical protein